MDHLDVQAMVLLFLATTAFVVFLYSALEVIYRTRRERERRDEELKFLASARFENTDTGTAPKKELDKHETDRIVMKHQLSKREQARGLRKALKSRKTPKWLKPSIRRYLRKLETQVRA